MGTIHTVLLWQAGYDNMTCHNVIWTSWTSTTAILDEEAHLYLMDLNTFWLLNNMAIMVKITILAILAKMTIIAYGLELDCK